MHGKARVAHIDQIRPVDVPSAPDGSEWIPVRHELGVEAFGVNAFIGKDVGDEIIGEHTEAEAGDPQHQELYFVVRGHAVFVVNDERIDAPHGTFVFVPDPTSFRGATAQETDTAVIVVGSQVGTAFAVSDWEAKYTDRRSAPTSR